MSTQIPLEVAIAERDRILMDMDSEAAKSFIAKTGGFVPKSNKINWVRVLHLARFEVRSLPEVYVKESQMWLARNGAQSILMLPPTSPYLRAAMDLIFPKTITDAFIAHMEVSAG